MVQIEAGRLVISISECLEGQAPSLYGKLFEDNVPKPPLGFCGIYEIHHSKENINALLYQR